MSLYERFRQWRRSEREKLAPLRFRDKLDHIFTYYKGWMLGFLLLCLLLGYVGDAVAQSRKETLLQGFFTNDVYDLFPAQKLQSEYAARLHLGKGRRIVFDDALYIDLNGEATEYSAASRGKIIAYIASQELDFVVTTKEVYEYFADNIPLLDFGELLSGELYAQLEPQLVPATDENGRPIYGALDLAASRYLAGREHGDVDYYLFIPRNAPHTEALRAFLAYCFSAS